MCNAMGVNQTDKNPVEIRQVENGFTVLNRWTEKTHIFTSFVDLVRFLGEQFDIEIYKIDADSKTDIYHNATWKEKVS